LIVEDDRAVRGLLAAFLSERGFLVSVAADSREMDEILATQRIHLLLLDIMLPREDGLSICRRVRAQSSIPIIMLTARDSEVDRVIGLEMGADDYLVKPVGTYELLARIRALFRRSQFPWLDLSATRARVVRFAGWTLDLPMRLLRAADGTRVPLTGSEYKLLVAFCERANRVLTREQLLELIRDRTAAGADRSIDVQISRLRRKIEPDASAPSLIQTVRSGGYVFTAQVEFV
jgi:two-component system, OmpR family, response regulator